MRVSLSGPHGSGKTTLLAALQDQKEFANISFLPEITRVIKQHGYSINEQGSEKTQILVINKHMDNLFYHDNFITDRSLIDGVVYSQYMYHIENMLSPAFMRYIDHLFDTYLTMYDAIFYIPAEFELHDDGVRSTNDVFYNFIKMGFEHQIVKAQEVGANVVTVAGNPQERINIVLQEMRRLSSVT